MNILLNGLTTLIDKSYIVPFKKFPADHKNMRWVKSKCWKTAQTAWTALVCKIENRRYKAQENERTDRDRKPED